MLPVPNLASAIVPLPPTEYREMSEMRERSRSGEPGDGHGCMAPEGTMLRLRQRELMAQLHDLLFPPAPSGGVGASSSSGLNYNHDVVAAAGLAEDDECSPVRSKVRPPAGGRRGRRISGSKRPFRDVDEQDGEELGGRGGGGGAGATAKPPPPPAARSRRKQEGSTTTTLVTTVPDFDGYQWRKYGQKHIEAAKHIRSYYRCTNSVEQGCPAKRTVERNDADGGGRPPKYTVVYISEHTCKMTESASLAPPVILETTVRAPAAASSPAGVAVVDVPAAKSSTAATGSTGTADDVSPANLDITWSGGGDTHGDFSHVFSGDDWEHPTPAVLQQEMELAGPIRSPVHIVAAEYGNWSYGLFLNELSVASSCHLFGF